MQEICPVILMMTSLFLMTIMIMMMMMMTNMRMMIVTDKIPICSLSGLFCWYFFREIIIALHCIVGMLGNKNL